MATTTPLEPRELYRHPLAGAVVEVVAERGFAAASVDEISARAGVERAEFFRHFRDLSDAVARVFDAYIDNFQGIVKAAYESGGPWPDSLRAASHASLRWIAERPAATRFGMVGVLEAGERPRLARERLFIWCAGLIEDGRKVAPDPAAVPEGAALMAVGACVEILSRIVQGTLDADLAETAPKVMYGAVRPYLGEEAARRELEIELPPGLSEPIGFGRGAPG